jgi:uncharacterized C2H2 Zn-finger protein
VGICEPENVVEDVQIKTASDSIDYAFNLDISVHVVDTKSDEIDAEFREAMVKIEVKKSFPCPQCAKICKSKGGLTKHTNSKHLDVVVQTFKLPKRKRVCQKRI